MFYRNTSGLRLSDLPAITCACEEAAKPAPRLGLASRLLLVGTTLATPFVALFIVLAVQGLSALK